jgi:hypothetical protein
MPLTSSTLPVAYRCSPRSRGTPLQEPDEALDQATVADLSPKQIARMTCLELARVVRVGRLPTVQARPEHLDRATLERLAHLACLSCRNQRYTAATWNLS